MRAFNKEKTTKKQLLQLFLDDFLEGKVPQASHSRYRQNKLWEYLFLTGDGGTSPP
jgi:hypothetical protein